MNALINKPVISITNTAFLAIIGMFQFVQPIIVDGIDVKQVQSEIALIGILVAFCIFPSIFLILSAIILRWFPLDGPEWLEKKKTFIKLHEEKEKAYLKLLSKHQKHA